MRRHSHFSEYSGRVEEICSRRTDQSSSARTSRPQTRSGLSRKRGGLRSTGTGLLEGWIPRREWGSRVRGGVEERTLLGSKEVPHGPQGLLQEAYDAECASIARALAEAVERAKRRKLGMAGTAYSPTPRPLSSG